MSTRILVSLAALAITIGQAALVSAAWVDITRPDDPLERVDGFNQQDTSDGPPPAGEVASHAIDDIGQKYLNFLDLSSGIQVTPSANPNNDPVVAIRLYTANDAEPRDPASFQLSGSNDSISGPWTHIASGNLALPSGRNPGGGAVAIPPTGNLSAFNQTVEFPNTESFAHYQIIFPTLKDAVAANSMQIAEIELIADVVPEPTAVSLFGLAILGLTAALRRRR